MTKSHKIIENRKVVLQILVLFQNCLLFNGEMRKHVLEEVCRTVLSASCFPSLLSFPMSLPCHRLSIRKSGANLFHFRMIAPQGQGWLLWIGPIGSTDMSRQRHTCTCLNNKWKNFIHPPSNHHSSSISQRATTYSWPRHTALNLWKAGGNNLLVSPPIF
jgi:hypothetical protein